MYKMTQKIKTLLKKVLFCKQNKISEKPRNRTDNIYLVSFPKSGNTWISFLIANAINEYLDLKMKVNFFNIHFFIPEISDSTPSNLEYYPFRKIIKSHNNFTKDYRYIFLLIRNPYDVMISYFYYLKNLNQYNKNFSSFIRDEKYGIKAWCKHTESWLNESIPSQRLHIFFYEDFKQNPEKELKKMFNLMGFNTEHFILKEAVEKSNFSNMKILEKTTGSYSMKKYEKFTFVRKGEVTNGKELPGLDKKFIEEETEKITKMIRNIKHEM